MKSDNSTKTIDQVRVILGLLRETIFLQTQFELTVDSDAKSISAELANVEENSRRSEEESRYLTFRHRGPSTSHNLSKGETIQIRFGIQNFVVRAFARIAEVRESQNEVSITTEVPSTLEIENARKSRRKKSDTQLGVATLLIRSGNSHTEGVFEFYDYSRGGYGGTLKVPSGFRLVNDTSVQGTLRLGSESISINCRVTRARLIAERPGDWDSYDVGLKNESNLDKKQISVEETESFIERRRTSRLSVQEQVYLTSALNREITFKLIVGEASITGFSGHLANPAHLIEFPVGSSFKMDSPPISVCLEGFDGERLRFSIQDGTLNDRLQWFKRVSPYLLEGVSHSVFDARDLLEVFCASGALSTDFLRTQKTHRNEFLSPFESSTQNHFWIHRWVHHNSEKQVTGHWCALKIGDNAWFLADLAGSPEKVRKIPRNFTELFFKSFAEFSLSQSPCPVHMYTWVMNHPYWQEFSEKVKESGNVRERALVGYTRYETAVDLGRETNSSFRTDLIGPTEYQRISRICDRLRGFGTINHASLLDFDVDRFGSPNLVEHFRNSGHSFRRHYFEFSTNKTSWLAVFSSFPSGASFNRVPESIWVFPIEGEELDLLEDWKGLSTSLFQTSLSLGIKPSSIRRVFNAKSSATFQNELAVLENLIVHPLASTLYEGKK